MPTGRLLFERPVAGWFLLVVLCAGGGALLWVTIDQWFFGWEPECTRDCVWVINGRDAGPATVQSQRNAAWPFVLMCLGVGSAFVAGPMITVARWRIARRRGVR